MAEGATTKTATAAQPRARVRFHDASLPLDRLPFRDAAPSAADVVARIVSGSYFQDDDPAAPDVVALLASAHYSVRIAGGDILATWSGSPEADVPGESRWPIQHFSAEQIDGNWVICQRTADPGPQRGPTPQSGGSTTVADKAAINDRLRTGNARVREQLIERNA